jgi:hypothetical protein
MSDRPNLTELLKVLPGWKQNPKYKEHVWCNVITNDQGHEVRIELERGRLRFVGHWPDGQHPDQGLSITVKADLPASKIAAEFSRRFLPEYLDQWAQLELKAQAAANFQAELEKARNVLAALPGVKRCQHSTDLYGPGCTHLIVQGPDSVRLKLRGNVTVKQLKRILAVLNKG